MIGLTCFHLMHSGWADWSPGLRMAVEFSALITGLASANCLIGWLIICEEKWWIAVLQALAFFAVLFSVGVAIIYFTMPEALR